MPAGSSTQLEAFLTEGGQVIRVAGRGTMRESRVFHEFACACLNSAPQEARAEGHEVLTLDVSACERLDSTFLGCLVDLHKRFNREGHTLFAVAGPPEVRRELLGICRLDRLLPVRDRAPDAIGAGQALAADGPLGPRELGEHVLECHRRLAEQGGPASEAFARVADQLEKELSAMR